MQAVQDDIHSPSRPGRMLLLIPILLLIVGVAIGGTYLAKSASGSTARAAEESKTPDSASDVHVEVVKPTKGLLERKTAQAGTVWAFEWIDIYSEVPGFLKMRMVDIGDAVEKGDVLAVIDVPELKARVEQQTAAVGLAQAQKNQKAAAIDSAKAGLDAIKAKIKAAKAKVKSDKAYLVFREKQQKRFQELLAEKSIDARLVDEQADRYEAALETVNASEEAVNSAMAQKDDAAAKIVQAEADLEEAKQKIKVAQAELDHATVMVNFATIRAQFGGVITHRNAGFDNGAYIRAGASTSPLLTLQHTDTMRMVVPIPDLEVPYCKPGAEAIIVFDALPNEKFTYKVSRIAGTEDLQTKTMRVEVDIPNPDGRIRQGMYGLVTITLKKVENALSIPSACLVGTAEGGKASVYVVRKGQAHLVPIKTGLDNGILVEVLSGLEPNDNVVVNSSGGIGDDIAVTMTEVKKTKGSPH